MKSYPFDRAIHNEADLLNFYIDGVYYRNKHKAQSTEIAMHIFDTTHPTTHLSFAIDSKLDRLRDEFGALEAPGMPEDDDTDPDEYIDTLWIRLLGTLKKEQEKRTV